MFSVEVGSADVSSSVVVARLVVAEVVVAEVEGAEDVEVSPCELVLSSREVVEDAAVDD